MTGKRSNSVEKANQPSRSITIKHVAAHLGVSFSTVSRALADHRHTSDAMKLRVRAAAAELGYIPHSGARQMHSRHSGMIGLVIPDIRNQIFAAAAEIMAERCREAGFQLILSFSGRDRVIEHRQLEMLRERRAAGIIIAPCGDSLPETHQLLTTFPAVQLARRNAALDVPTVTLDDRGGMFRAVRHLIQLGHRRIAVIVGTSGLVTSDERNGGARDAFTEAAITPDEKLIIAGPLTSEFGRSATARLLSLAERPTAIVAANSLLTLGALEAVHDAGVTVPDDLSLIGFGDLDWFRLWGPGLTTVSLPIRDLAEAAAAHLMDQIHASANETRAPLAMTLPTNLLLRGSTAPPR